VKLRDSEKKARLKFWLGSIGALAFGFTTLIALLKSIHVSLSDMGTIGSNLSDLVGKLINFIYSYTDFLPIFWDTVWVKLPILDTRNLLQESNYYFFGLFAVTLISIIQIQDSFWIRSKINKAKRKIDDELLERDIKKQSGLIEGGKPDILELEINIGSPDPWYKRPSGIIAIGLFVAIVGRIIASFLGVNG